MLSRLLKAVNNHGIYLPSPIMWKKRIKLHSAMKGFIIRGIG
jgi:hypothetical protein